MVLLLKIVKKKKPSPTSEDTDYDRSIFSGIFSGVNIILELLQRPHRSPFLPTLQLQMRITNPQFILMPFKLTMTLEKRTGKGDDVRQHPHLKSKSMCSKVEALASS